VSELLLETVETTLPVYAIKLPGGKGATATITLANKGEMVRVAGTEGQATWAVRQSDGGVVGFATKSRAMEYLRKQLSGKKIPGPKTEHVGQFRDPEGLLNEIKLRANEVLRNDIKDFREEFIAQGGNAGAFDRYAALMQGLPFYDQSRNPAIRTAKVATTVIGAAQISRAAFPNVFQTLLLPGYIGWGRYVRAIIANLTPGGGEYRKGIELGAYRYSGLHASFGTGFTLEKLQEQIGSRAARYSLFEGVNQLNRSVAATGTRLLAEDWRSRGILDSEMWLTRRYELTDSEIADIQNHKMSDRTFAKIVQRGVATTQYDTESRQRLGLIQAHPFWGQVFSYQMYSSAAMRSTLEMFDEASRGIADLRAGRGPKRFMLASHRLLHNLTLYAGSGLVMYELRGVLFGAPPQDDDKTLIDKALRGLVETQFLGPVTRMLMWGDSHNTNVDKAFTALTPKLKAVLDIIGLGYNLMTPSEWSKFSQLGQLSAGTQAEALVGRHFGAYKSARQWIDRVAWPAEDTWREGRRLSTQFEKSQGRVFKTVDAQINPEYYNIRIAVRRGDIDAARREASAYYCSHKGGDFAATIRNLRESLMQNRPIHVAKKDYLRAIGSMPADARARVFRADVTYCAIVDSLAPAAGR
jgi:hypothetical protein